VVKKPAHFYALFSMGGVLLFVKIAPTADGVKIFNDFCRKSIKSAV